MTKKICIGLILLSVGSAVAQPVKIPSPEEEALYVKKVTWKETAIATFENAHQFDADLHLAELSRRKKIEMVAKIAGPFQATGGDSLNIEEKGDSVSVMGKDYPWRVLAGFKSRDGNDLAQMAGLKKGDCALFRLDLVSTGDERVYRTCSSQLLARHVPAREPVEEGQAYRTGIASPVPPSAFP